MSKALFIIKIIQKMDFTQALKQTAKRQARVAPKPTKGDKTKAYIQNFVTWFRMSVDDEPTQREVAVHLKMSERTVQRHYTPMWKHKFNQVGIRYPQGDTYNEFQYWLECRTAYGY